MKDRWVGHLGSSCQPAQTLDRQGTVLLVFVQRESLQGSTRGDSGLAEQHRPPLRVPGTWDS